MERKVRIWLSLGAAALVGSGAAAGQPAPAPDYGPAERGRGAFEAAAVQSAGSVLKPLRLAQFEGGEGGEGEGGEGGGQILGTITEFRLASTDPHAFSYDATKQVEAYGALVYERNTAAHEAAARMQNDIARLLEAPGADTLDAARAAWSDARATYARTEAFLFYAGPIDGPGGPISRIASWPIDPAFIDHTGASPDGGIVNDPSVAIDRFSLVRMNQAGHETEVTTGWHVIEFLLWGEDSGANDRGARTYTDYVPGQGHNDRRRQLLEVVTQLLVTDLSTVVASWAPGTNNYRGAILAMDQRNAIGRAFNGMAVLAGYELALKRIGASLYRGGDFEQARFSDNTSAELVADLAGILLRLTPDGALDESFGNFIYPESSGPAVGLTPRPGVAVFNPVQVDGGFAECYKAVRQSTGGYVTTGYGAATAEGDSSSLGYAPSLAQDVVSFRVSDGGLDTGWGNDGTQVLQSEGRGTPTNEERSRAIVVLPDDRTVHAGRFGGLAAVYVLTPDGQLDTEQDGGGIITLPHPTINSQFFNAVLSPDASRIALTTNNNENGARLVVLEIDG